MAGRCSRMRYQPAEEDIEMIEDGLSQIPRPIATGPRRSPPSSLELEPRSVPDDGALQFVSLFFASLFEESIIFVFATFVLVLSLLTMLILSVLPILVARLLGV